MLIYNVLYHNMQNIVIIIGPTASGKTALSIKLAKEINGEIISADSRQVYKYLDVGSGKITTTEMENIKHYGLDISNPEEKFTTSDWNNYAKNAIVEIVNKNKIPIICGGTGLYIDALLYGINENPPPNYIQRKELESKSLEQIQLLLIEKLKKIDQLDYYNNLNNSEKNNKARLIRKLELDNYDTKNIKERSLRPMLYSPKFIILNPDIAELKEKINTRLLQRLNIEEEYIKSNNPNLDKFYNELKDEAFIQASPLINEVIDLIYNKKVKSDWLVSLGLEYRYITLFLENKITLKDCIETLETKILQYAKRQKTWNQRYNALK